MLFNSSTEKENETNKQTLEIWGVVISVDSSFLSNSGETMKNLKLLSVMDKIEMSKMKFSSDNQQADG